MGPYESELLQQAKERRLRMSGVPARPEPQGTHMEQDVRRELDDLKATVKRQGEVLTTLNDFVSQCVSRRKYKTILSAAESAAQKVILIETVIAAVSEAFQLGAHEIRSPRRSQYVVDARHACFYVAKRLTLYTIKDIGRRIGGFDHSSVRYGLRRAEELYSKGGEFRRKVDYAQSRILGD